MIIEKKNDRQIKTVFFLGGLVGIVIFIMLYGVKMLDVTNVDWLYALAGGGDVSVTQASWEFFRNDSWHFPVIGYISNAPTSTGGSLLIQDIAPLFAVFFKLFRGILPDRFQYIGIWHFFNSIMQGGFACCILYKYLKKLSVCLCLTPLFLLFPPLLWRSYNHHALAGHWVLFLVIFIWVYRDEFFDSVKRQLIAWVAVTSLAVWVQIYYIIPVGFAMVGFLLREWMRDRSWKKPALIFPVSVIGVLLSFWILGGFLFAGSADIGGFGNYSMNLLSLFDSDGYSSIIPDIPSSPWNYEGWQYLGLSGIVLLIAAVIITIYRAASSDDWLEDLDARAKKLLPILLAVLPVTIIALSPEVYFGSVKIIDYSWFTLYKKLLGSFRCSGRTWWICAYGILLFSAVIVFKRIKRPVPAIIAALLLTGVQLYDLSPLIAAKSALTNADVIYTSPLASDFWEDAAGKVQHIYRLSYNHWGVVEDYPMWFYATKNNLTINNMYVSRNDDAVNLENIEQGEQAVVNGTLREDTLYCVLDKWSFTTASMTGEDVVELYVDNYYVFIHKNIWDRLDQEKYRDYYMPNTGEYLLVRESFSG